MDRNTFSDILNFMPIRHQNEEKHSLLWHTHFTEYEKVNITSSSLYVYIQFHFNRNGVYVIVGMNR